MIEGRKYFLAFFPVVAINQICPQSGYKDKNYFLNQLIASKTYFI